MKKTREITALVTGVGGDVGQGIIKSLRISALNVRIVGCDCRSDAAGFFMCDKHYVVPKASSADYLDEMLAVCEKEGVDAVFSSVESELPILAENADLFSGIGAKVIVQPADVLQRFLDKLSTHRFLKDLGVSTPKTFMFSAENKEKISELLKNKKRLILKPRAGCGSRGIHIISSEKELRCYRELLDSDAYVVQEYISSADEEYTAAVFGCPGIRKPYVIVFKRKLFGDLTGIAEVVFDEAIESVCRDIAAGIRLCGSINVQLRMESGKPLVFEVNPRFSSTTGIRANCGFNDVEMAVEYLVFGRVPHKPSIKRRKAFRYWEEIYIDL